MRCNRIVRFAQERRTTEQHLQEKENIKIRMAQIHAQKIEDQLNQTFASR